MNREVVIDGEINLSLEGSATCDLELECSGEFGEVIRIEEYSYPVYTGETTVTPTEETQVLQTSETTVLENITINPIPSNYGRIAWDGHTIHVY